MEKDQLTKTFDEIEGHIFKARNLLYGIYKEIEEQKKKVIKNDK